MYQNIHKILIYIKKILTICNSKFEKNLNVKELLIVKRDDNCRNYITKHRGKAGKKSGNSSKDSTFRTVLIRREVSPRRNLLSTFTEISEESASKKWERKRRRLRGSKCQVSRIIENLSKLLSRCWFISSCGMVFKQY